MPPGKWLFCFFGIIRLCQASIRLKTCVNLCSICPGFHQHKGAFYYFCAMAKKHTVFLLLGSNIHPRTGYLKKAIGLINSSLGKVTLASALYESEPWGFEAPVAFLNQVLCVETAGDPLDVLKKTQEIEQKLGRVSKTKGAYSSRTLDIDMLFYDDEVVQLPELTVPHAQMANRRFTLMPLAEVAPGKIHPVLNKTCRQLLDDCDDDSKVWKFKGKQIHAL